MTAGTIIAVIVGIIILYLVMSWWFDSSSYLSGLRDGKKSLSISADKLTTSSGHSANFSYSIWFYINDWNYQFGQEKTIFTRGGKHGHGPKVSLDPYENNMTVEIPVYSHETGGSPGSSLADPQPANCDSGDCSDGARPSHPGGSSHSSIHKCNASGSRIISFGKKVN